MVVGAIGVVRGVICRVGLRGSRGCVPECLEPYVDENAALHCGEERALACLSIIT